jgi:hypothetical protein
LARRDLVAGGACGLGVDGVYWVYLVYGVGVLGINWWCCYYYKQGLCIARILFSDICGCVFDMRICVLWEMVVVAEGVDGGRCLRVAAVVSL